MKHGYAILFSLIIISGIAVAVPAIPHQFYGDVTINGSAASDGTPIVAEINGSEYGVTTANGKYGVKPGELMFVQDPNSTRQGQLIEFYVDGVFAASHTFQSGDYTELDLGITQEAPPQPQENPPAAPGGGGGGGSPSDSALLTVSKRTIAVGENVTIRALCKWSFGCLVYADDELLGDIVMSSGYQSFNHSFSTPGEKKAQLYWKGTTNRLVAEKSINVTGEAIDVSPPEGVEGTGGTVVADEEPEETQGTGEESSTLTTGQGNTDLEQPGAELDEEPENDGTTTPTGFFGLGAIGLGSFSLLSIILIIIGLVMMYLGRSAVPIIPIKKKK